MNEKINFKENEFGYIEYKSKNPYEFYQIFNELDEAETQDSFGWLIFPEQGKKPYPVVVCAHGSDNWAGHHHEHILNFLNNGIAVFKAHSFDSRGVSATVEDQLSVTTAMMMVDVVEPLKFLSRHPDIDANKIAITGWSLGGMVAFYAAWEPIMEKLAPNGERFCAHLPFYPPTFLNPDEHRWSKAPILNLIGSKNQGLSMVVGKAISWSALLMPLPFILSITVWFADGSSTWLTSALVFGLLIFGFIFAINSSLHSYLILAFGDTDRITRDVGFYYMANAAGRLIGTLLSGLSYQFGGLACCLAVAGLMTFLSWFTAKKLKHT